jgi:hypothetical protein
MVDVYEYIPLWAGGELPHENGTLSMWTNEHHSLENKVR